MPKSSVSFFVILIVTFVLRVPDALAIAWVDFSSWPNGSLSQNGLQSTDGLQLDAAFTSSPNFRSDYPQAFPFTIDDPSWPFINNQGSAVGAISNGSSTLTTELSFEFTNPGDLPAGGSIAVVDLESLASSVVIEGFFGGSPAAVNWAVAFFQTSGPSAAPPTWDPATNTLTGTNSNWPDSSNNFAFFGSGHTP